MPEAKASRARIQEHSDATFSLRDICEPERQLSINKNKVIFLSELEYSTPWNIKRKGKLDEGGEESRGIYRGKKREENTGDKQGQTRIMEGGQI